MKLLELFSGTGSVGKVFKENGWTVVSLDRDMEADIKTDIMDWDYMAMYEPGSFDVLWTSPPCTEYSVAKTVGVRKITEANQVVQRTLDIIDYFQPKFWLLENPANWTAQEPTYDARQTLHRRGLLQIRNALQETNEDLEQRARLDPATTVQERLRQHAG